MRERYWIFFREIKYYSYYYQHFQAYFRKVNWTISALLTITALGSVAAWDVWTKHQIVWAIIICTSQVVQALFPKLPYNDLLISTQFMISALDKLLISVEHDWCRLGYETLSEDEINALLNKHQLEYSELVNQFFAGTYLPTISRCVKKAEKDCDTYFQITYNSISQEALNEEFIKRNRFIHF